MITILNTAILTSFGAYDYQQIDLEEAREIVKNNAIQSAVGHQATADILSSLLERPIPVNRIEYTQKVEEEALVFKLNGRPAEGKILTVEEIEEIGYTFGLLTKLED